MDNLHSRPTSNLVKKSEIFCYSQKEDPKISRTAKFGGDMLCNTENIVVQSLQILYIFVLRAEKVTNFAAISAQKW